MNGISRTWCVVAAVIVLGGCAVSPDRPASMAQANGITKDPHCMAVTGSLIPPRSNECTANGHSYSGKDIQQTGFTTTGAALNDLDPTLKKH